jgi:hypothetical protein
MIYTPGVLKDNSITTAKIVADAVTQIVKANFGEFATANAGFTDITNATVTITTNGGKVILMFCGGHLANSGAGISGAWTILRGATNLGDATWGLAGCDTNAGSGCIIILEDEPAAGTYTYKAQVKAIGGGTIYTAFDAGTPGGLFGWLIAMEVKR